MENSTANLDNAKAPLTAPQRLLVVCNGHGEDAIASRILLALQKRQPQLEIAALPLVGTGDSFQQQGIPVVTPTKRLPSGGFIYMDGRQLAKDLQAGLVQLTLAQWRAMKAWAGSGGHLLAVGDLFPLLFAWLSDRPYWFVGTAKSEYYQRTDTGRLPSLPWYEGWGKSIYLPWERWLMNHGRCQGAIVRDDLTAARLRQAGLTRVHQGNPMMDNLDPQGLASLHPPDPALTLTLLPGSRPPEAHHNWGQIIAAVNAVIQQLPPGRRVHGLGAIASSLDLAPFRQILGETGWQPDPAAPRDAHHYQRGTHTLILTQSGYGDCLHLADCGIAMAGTATEQLVGLGKPVFTLAGLGPQFTPQFAEAQTRLLGPSVLLCPSPTALATTLLQTLRDPDFLQYIYDNGHRRMGSPGAADRIAQLILRQGSAAD